MYAKTSFTFTATEVPAAFFFEGWQFVEDGQLSGDLVAIITLPFTNHSPKTQPSGKSKGALSIFHQ